MAGPARAPGEATRVGRGLVAIFPGCGPGSATGAMGPVGHEDWDCRLEGRNVMAEQDFVVVYAATYPTVAAAQEVLETIEHLHKEISGTYDAAVVDQENGQAHVVKRMNHPHVRIIPEWFGGGDLTRKELDEAAEELLAGEAGLIVVGEATIEPALDKALAGNAKVVKREIAATVDEITSELQAAFKG
jgi:hypothetical protein